MKTAEDAELPPPVFPLNVQVFRTSFRVLCVLCGFYLTFLSGFDPVLP